MGINMRGKINSDMIEANSIQTIHLQNGSVETAKMASQAVTASILADGAITTSKVSEKVRTREIGANDVEVSVLGTTSTEVKSLRFSVKESGNITPDKIIVACEVKSSNASATATLEAYIDEEATPRTSVMTTSTNYELSTFSFQVGAGAGAGQLTEGIHTLSIRLKSSSATETAYNMLLEIRAAIL